MPNAPLLPDESIPDGGCCGCLIGGMFVIGFGLLLPVLLPNCGYIPFLFGG